MRFFKKQNNTPIDYKQAQIDREIDELTSRVNKLDYKLDSAWLDGRIAAVIDGLLAEKSYYIVSKMNDKEVTAELIRDEFRSLKNKRARLERAIMDIDDALAEADIKE